MWVINDNPYDETSAGSANETIDTCSARFSEKKIVTKGSLNLWHRRMGHLSRTTMAKYLPSVTNDIEISDLG